MRDTRTARAYGRERWVWYGFELSIWRYYIQFDVDTWASRRISLSVPNLLTQNHPTPQTVQKLPKPAHPILTSSPETSGSFRFLEGDS